MRKKRLVKNHSFAVVGTYRGAGVTLLAINFAVYLAKIMEGNIAVIELNDSGDFLRLEKEVEDMRGFSRMDMGFCIENIRSEQKIVVGSHFEWRICEYEHFVSCVQQISGSREWEYVDTAGKKSGKIHFIDNGRIKLKNLPVIEDVFEVSEAAERVYQTFL